MTEPNKHNIVKQLSLSKNNGSSAGVPGEHLICFCLQASGHLSISLIVTGDGFEKSKLTCSAVVASDTVSPAAAHHGFGPGDVDCPFKHIHLLFLMYLVNFFVFISGSTRV